MKWLKKRKGCRIYVKDKRNDKIEFWEQKGIRINRWELEEKLKKDWKSFLYCSYITDGRESKD